MSRRALGVGYGVGYGLLAGVVTALGFYLLAAFFGEPGWWWVRVIGAVLIGVAFNLWIGWYRWLRRSVRP